MTAKTSSFLVVCFVKEACPWVPTNGEVPEAVGQASQNQGVLVLSPDWSLVDDAVDLTYQRSASYGMLAESPGLIPRRPVG